MEGAPKIAAALREHRIARGRDVLAVVIEELPAGAAPDGGPGTCPAHAPAGDEERGQGKP